MTKNIAVGIWEFEGLFQKAYLCLKTLLFVFFLQMVLAPTKSCIVKCRNVFSVNGEPQTTKTYTVSVDVPVFADGSIGYTGALTQELAQFYGVDDLKVQQAMKKYLYDPNSIRENGKEDEA